MFFTQVLMYGLLCINYRAIAQANYPLIVISDFIFASTNFFIIKKIAKDDNGSVFLWIGYTTGGVVGSLIGVWSSQHYFNN